MPKRLLEGDELAEAGLWLAMAADVAQQAGCVKRKCGTVIVSAAGEIIGRGFNGLAGGFAGREDQACVHCTPYALHPGFKSDKTCCMHAEQRAVMDALRSGAELKGSTLFFSSVDEHGDSLISGKPFCTICSKMALDAGVEYWVLEHAEGITRYRAAEYNRISFAYDGEGG